MSYELFRHITMTPVN